MCDQERVAGFHVKFLLMLGQRGKELGDIVFIHKLPIPR